ncbi:MAG TPA: allantoicase [Trebonia sp.]|jgi:allantoicase|nr:allantoicase [Trebonia sp.]
MADDGPLAPPPDGLGLPDVAARALRGSVAAASDEFFAEKENLIKPGPATFSPATFGHKGQLYDGWETRRKRGPDGGLPGAGEHDWAIVALGAPAIVHAVVVDTAWFRGNYPQSCSVEACYVPGYPDAAALARAPWAEIVPRSPLRGDAAHAFAVAPRARYSHVRLRAFPDGGIARLRVHGQVIPDPALLDGLTFDLAALENGGDVTGCSDQYYSVPRNAISPGLPRVMGEGWETRRRRAAGNEWLTVSLTGRAVPLLATIDTSGYLGNSPGAARLTGTDGAGGEWFDLLPRTALRPDTEHRFRLGGARPVTSVRLEVYPDGGIARLRLHGSLTQDGLAALARRWEQAAPAGG